MRITRHETAVGQNSLFADIPIGPPCRCRGCKRAISSAKSLERGYGLSCWVRRLEKMIKNETEDPPHPPLPQKLPVAKKSKTKSKHIN
jgi:hypothetical protein